MHRHTPHQINAHRIPIGQKQLRTIVCRTMWVGVLSVLMTACATKPVPQVAQPLPEQALENVDDYEVIDLSKKNSTSPDWQTADELDQAQVFDELQSFGSSVPLNAISPSTLQNFVTVIDAIRHQYVGDVSDEALFSYAMSGMLKKVDTYGEYLDQTALENLRAFTEGSVASVGIVANYSLDVGQWVVDYVVPDSPASKADIRTGDYLHEIAGVRLNDGHTNQDITQLLSGIAGTQIDVVTSHAGRSKHTNTLQRTIAQDEGLAIGVKDGIAVVHLPVFTARTKDELRQALVRIQEPVFGIVLDVRNNPGGVLTSAVEVAGLFVADKPAVQVVGKKPQDRKTLHTNHHAPLQSVPVLVLQNRYSASAAEVLSAILLANGTTIAGETSYGKGSVQSIISLGNNEAIKLTTAHYQTADGQKIDGVGVVPNLVLSDDSSMWLDQAVQALLAKKPQKGVKFALSDDY